MIPLQATLNSTVSTKEKMLTPEGGREDELANMRTTVLGISRPIRLYFSNLNESRDQIVESCSLKTFYISNKGRCFLQFHTNDLP